MIFKRENHVISCHTSVSSGCIAHVAMVSAGRCSSSSEEMTANTAFTILTDSEAKCFQQRVYLMWTCWRSWKQRCEQTTHRWRRTAGYHGDDVFHVWSDTHSVFHKSACTGISWSRLQWCQSRPSPAATIRHQKSGSCCFLPVLTASWEQNLSVLVALTMSRTLMCPP